MKNTVFIILVSALVAVTVGFISNPKNNQNNWIQYGLKKGEKVYVVIQGDQSTSNLTTGTINITESKLLGIEHVYKLKETKESEWTPKFVKEELSDRIIVGPEKGSRFEIIYPKDKISFITKILD